MRTPKRGVDWEFFDSNPEALPPVDQMTRADLEAEVIGTRVAFAGLVRDMETKREKIRNLERNLREAFAGFVRDMETKREKIRNLERNLQEANETAYRLAQAKR
jgi:molybdopterin synthase catalytic subunit